MESAIRTEDLCIVYGKKTVLQGITVDFPKNSITSIIGPSGCGKTTLLLSLDDMIREVPDAMVSGDVYIGKEKTSSMPQSELRRRVGLVFQTPVPFPFSVYDNLTYAPKYYGNRDRKNLDRIVREKLEMVGLYDEIKDDLWKSALKFSGGQQQRICIARALTADPDVLLLDEPCSALDIKSTSIIEETLKKLKEKYTIIIVTHNIAQARRLSDKVVFLKDGRLIEEGDAGTFFNSPEHPDTNDFLGGVYG
ncbi:ABC-type phosphate transport system, ATPase component [Lachnospiraceae bacterium JC7]|nr:ABC-type phosphate transport system, ATPase component [Lachnospiraceae bacterium JC7]